MDKKRFWLASLASFVVLSVLEMILHGVILAETYKDTASLWRPEADMKRLMWICWLSYAIASVMMTFLYSKGHEAGKKGAGQGLRFGLLIGLLMTSSMSLGCYFSMPIPASLAIAWFIGGLIEYIAAGAAIGTIYRPKQL